MKITRAMLKDYRKNKRAIPYLKEELKEAKKEAVSDTVKDYRSGYPHTRVITGAGTVRYDQLRARLQKKEEQVRTVDAWIESIQDDQTRMVFDFYYRKGRTWRAVADSIGYGGNEDYPRVVIRDGYLKRMKIR
jgi:hypothetical protein